MRKLFFFLWLLLLAGCDNQAILYTPYHSVPLGITFEYPESWALAADGIEVNVATDANLFAMDTADFPGGAVANFSIFPPEGVLDNLETTMSQLTDLLVANGDAEEIGVVQKMVVDDHEAVQTRVTLAEDTFLRVLMVQGEEQIILLVVIYDEGSGELVEYMVNSIVFTE